MDDFLINTDYNNQKILFESMQTLTMTIGNPVAFFNYTHGLGYVPVVRVWYEPEPGKWRPISTRQMQNYSPFEYISLVGTFSVDTETLQVEVRYLDMTFPISCRILVRVYLDD